MKFKIPGKIFQTHLQMMSKVLNSKNTIGALDNFLLKLADNTLTITGSDSENSMVSKIEVFDVEGTGEVAVSSRTLIDMSKEIGNQPITFEMNDETYHIDITYMNGKFELMGEDASEYPRQTEDNEESHTFTLPAEAVAKGIDNTLYAVSTDMLRPMMTGIFWDIKEDNITFVSTDTHKLVRYINRQVVPGFEGGFILPSKPASIIRAMIGKEDEEIRISMTSKGAVFEVGPYTLSCKFIKGSYPNYNRVIPMESPYAMTVARETLFNAIRRVALVSNKGTSLIRCTVSPSQIHIVARDYDRSRLGEERVECNYDGEEMTIGFSYEYMLQILGNMGGEEIRIRLSDPARPAIFEPMEKNADEELLVLQMPIQVLD